MEGQPLQMQVQVLRTLQLKPFNGKSFIVGLRFNEKNRNIEMKINEAHIFHGIQASLASAANAVSLPTS